MDLGATFLDRPLWLWGLFAAVVASLLAFDLGVLHRRARGRRVAVEWVGSRAKSAR